MLSVRLPTRWVSWAHRATTLHVGTAVACHSVPLLPHRKSLPQRRSEWMRRPAGQVRAGPGLVRSGGGQVTQGWSGAGPGDPGLVRSGAR